MRKQKQAAVSVAEHVLIPLHEKLTEKERQVVFDTYKITLKELPKILLSDQAIQKLNVKQGDIVKIIRRSPTAEETIFYRGVVHA